MDTASKDATGNIIPAWTDPATGLLYVHKDLVMVRSDYETEAHVGPIERTERFGDIASWCDYIARYANPLSTLAAWNTLGLSAILDYHVDGAEKAVNPGRCAWRAEHLFTPSRQWEAWANLVNGPALPQRAAIERLEDMGEDITDPDQARLMELLRTLRANVTATAKTALRPDGTASVSFAKDTSVRSSGGPEEMELPHHLTINIPVLRGSPIRYLLIVRMRLAVDDNAHLVFRFSMPGAEKAWEEVVAEQVAMAKTTLGDTFTILRGAD